MKKISFAAKPSGSNRQSADDWIGDKKTGEQSKRLTIDVPRKLHARIKSQCASRGEVMADEIRKLLEKHFPEEYDHHQGEGASTVPDSANTTL